MSGKKCASTLLMVLLAATGCTQTVRIGEGRGRPTKYEDPRESGRVEGVELQSQDIVSITDKMARDILASSAVAGRSGPPARIVIDAAYFRNESSNIINKNILTDRLRTELNRAARGRLVFLARHHANMVEKERILEGEGVVTGGKKGKTKPAYGYDLRLAGRITSLDSVRSSTGEKSRYHLITFELVERGSGVIVWSNSYEIRKSALDGITTR